jgi:VWFA-related protein
MRSLLTVAFSVALIATAASAQSTTPTPVSDDVVKISTSLIRVDVTVTGKDGRPISDLKPEDFEIYQDGVRQRIVGSNFVFNPQPKPAKQDKLEIPIPEPPVEIKPENVKRTIALVVDDLTLSFDSVALTRRALKKFVDEQMQDGDLVAIIRTGAGIGALQQFTTAKWQLYAAIDRVKWNPKGVGGFGSFDPIEPTMSETLRRAGDGKMYKVDKEDLQAEYDSLRNTADFRESIFTAGTLGALRYIVNGMESLPGRKSVMLFSDGMKIFSGDTQSGSYTASRTLAFLKSLVAEANRKSVVFYPLDARGLVYTGFTAADQLYDPNTQNDEDQKSLSDRINERSRDLFDSQQGLIYLAKKTGGFARTDRNDLSKGVQEVLEDQSYYLLAYEPTEGSFDPAKLRFIDIDVKVKRPGTNVRYRSGFAVGEEEKRVLATLDYPTKIMRALSSPFALNGVAVKLNALAGHSPKDGYFIHSFLHIGAKDLTFTKLPDGQFRASFDILAISYGDNGVPVDKSNLSGSTTVPAARLEDVRRNGIAHSFIFPVKVPGGYQLRVAVLDRESREVGSSNQFVSVPNLKKEGLALSGIVLQNISKNNWLAFASGGSQIPQASGSSSELPDPKYSTANRSFPRGSVLRFGVEILNGQKVKAAEGLTVRARVFHDRKLVFESAQRPVSTLIQRSIIPYSDAFELSRELPPGDYVLQIVLNDGTAKGKKKTTTQYVQFEVVDGATE